MACQFRGEPSSIYGGPVPVYVVNPTVVLGDLQQSVEFSHQKGRLRASVQAFQEGGFHTHWIASASQSAYDLALACAKSLSPTDSSLDPEWLFYATCLPWNGLTGDIASVLLDVERTGDVKPAMAYAASQLQHDMGWRRAQTVGLSQQGCTGLLGAMRLAHGMLSLGHPFPQQAVIVTSDRFPESDGAVPTLYEQSYNLISDAAAGCVMGTDLGSLAKYGPVFRYWGGLQVTHGAMGEATDDETVGMFFNVTHRLVKEVLSQVQWDIADVSWWVPQNTHQTAWRVLAKLLGISEDQVALRTLKDAGHLIAGDVFLNLRSLMAEGSLQPGQKLVLVTAGYGLTWQVACLEVMTQ